MPKILLVEDHEEIWDFLSRRLKRRGYDVVVAPDGQQGLDMARSEAPDLLLLDMNLPVMDVYESTKNIRAWEQEHDLPQTHIIALTALALKEEGEKILEAGCNAHMTKPIKRQTLLEVLKACEGRRRK